MTRPHDSHPEMTEADRDSETRFGIRPVPEGHRTAAPYAHRPMRSSRIPPSGPVSPDGRRTWPAPSGTAKVIVWGGVALGLAGIAAGTAMAVQALSGDDRPNDRQKHDRSWRNDDPRALAPRYAGLDEDEREAMRRRVRAQARRDAEAGAAVRARASRSRKSGGNFAQDLTRTANELSTGLNSVAQSLVSAFDAFRKVASQAQGIVGEFTTAADEFRGMLGTKRGTEPRQETSPHPYRPMDEPLDSNRTAQR